MVDNKFTNFYILQASVFIYSPTLKILEIEKPKYKMLMLSGVKLGGSLSTHHGITSGIMLYLSNSLLMANKCIAKFECNLFYAFRGEQTKEFFSSGRKYVAYLKTQDIHKAKNILSVVPHRRHTGYMIESVLFNKDFDAFVLYLYEIVAKNQFYSQLEFGKMFIIHTSKLYVGLGCAVELTNFVTERNNDNKYDVSFWSAIYVPFINTTLSLSLYSYQLNISMLLGLQNEFYNSISDNKIQAKWPIVAVLINM